MKKIVDSFALIEFFLWFVLFALVCAVLGALVYFVLYG